jgi:Cu/Ag efflux protein CusF
MRRAGTLACLTLLLLAGNAAAQAPRGSGAKPDYRGTGVILAMLPPPSDLHATRPVIVIEHEPIAGLMAEKMSMPFIAASTALFGGLHKGDRIAFGLKDTPDALLVVTIERLSGP